MRRRCGVAAWRGALGVALALAWSGVACTGATEPTASARLEALLGRGPVGGESLSMAQYSGLRGRYASGEGWFEIFDAGGELFARGYGLARGPLSLSGDRLQARLPDGSFLDLGASWPERVEIGDAQLSREPGGRPARTPEEWTDLLGHYRWLSAPDGPSIVVHEREGRLALAIGDLALDALVPFDGGVAMAPSSWAPGAALAAVRDDQGELVAVHLGDVELVPDPVAGEAGSTFRIEPTAPFEALRAAALAASPPANPAGLRDAELVELVAVVPDLRLDIRYATTDNFMGAVFYDEARAFMQRPAAEALARVQAALMPLGYGLLVHDAYRPWYVTKMFWDATPESQRIFVADPASGSRHNRGCAVDLTLVELATGEVVEMPGGYDEFSERSYPHYLGGTSRQRWHREILRRAMEAEGFAVYEFEWWHFDYRDWREYPILDATFDAIR